ncbi:Transglycosylase associated protein [compost metagenome]
MITGGGYGAIGNILLGIIGGIVGGLLFSLIGMGDATSGLIGTIGVGVIGAIIVIFGWRFLRRDRTPAT